MLKFLLEWIRQGSSKDCCLSCPTIKHITKAERCCLDLTRNIGADLQLSSDNNDEEAIHFVENARLMCKEMLECHPKFGGSFSLQCQQETVPNSLLALINMILHGSNIKDQREDRLGTSAATVISQLLSYNHVRHERVEKNRSPTSCGQGVYQCTLPWFNSSGTNTTNITHRQTT